MDAVSAARVQARSLGDVALQLVALGIRKADNAPCHGLDIVATPDRLHDSPGGVAIRTQQKVPRFVRHHGPQDKLRRNIRTPGDLLDPIEEQAGTPAAISFRWNRREPERIARRGGFYRHRRGKNVHQQIFRSERALAIGIENKFVRARRTINPPRIDPALVEDRRGLFLSFP